MSVRLSIAPRPRGFPSLIKQAGIVALWRAGFDHDEIAAITGVLDAVRGEIGGGIRQ